MALRKRPHDERQDKAKTSMEGSGAASLKAPAPTVPVEVLDTVFEVGLESCPLVLSCFFSCRRNVAIDPCR